MELSCGHLTYCTNIHAGETWTAHLAALQLNFPKIKSRVSPDKPMGIGLRLSNSASLDLIKESNMAEFQEWLAGNNAYVFTMNGFPYGDFHHTRVKDQVHAPDWTRPERLNYTLRLFRILSALLPKEMDGGISTSPLSYRYWFHTEEATRQAKDIATDQVLLVAEELIRIRRASGIIMHLDIEPEPDGLLETGDEFIQWFEEELLPKGTVFLKERFKIDTAEAGRLIKEHICLCYDVCHFAIGFEPHDIMIKQLAEKGIQIGKIQISAALKAVLPAEESEKTPIVDTFLKFEEPTYLHQVIAKRNDGTYLRYRDLSDAIADATNKSVVEWRAHFHVPIFMEDFGFVQSTQSDIIRVLDIQKTNPFTQHLEVETYTWEVLPEALKVPVDESIIRELEWVKSKIHE